MSKLVILVVEAMSDAWEAPARLSVQGIWMSGTLDSFVDNMKQRLSEAIYTGYGLADSDKLLLTTLNLIVEENQLPGVQDSALVPAGIQDA